MNEQIILKEKYRLIKEIAKGGMNSSIWKAEILSNLKKPDSYNYFFKKYCAVKIITLNKKQDPLQLANIEKEIQTTLRAGSKSNIFCDVYDFFWVDEFTSNPKVALVMEYVDGMPLSKYLKKKGILNVVEAIDYFEQILKALETLHYMNEDKSEIILHRDLKPDNILITSDFSTLKIIDLGISSVLEQKQTKKGIKRFLKVEEKTIYGSYPYVPPEIYSLSSKMNSEEKAKVVNEYWDIFAAGTILYELLTGEFPYIYESEDNDKKYLKPEHYDFPTIKNFVPEVSNQIENIVYKCITSRPESKNQRYKNIKEILEDIYKWKKNPNAEVEILKPAEDRKLEKIDNFIVKKTKFEINSLFWTRTFIGLSILVTLAIISSLLLVFLV